MEGVCETDSVIEDGDVWPAITLALQNALHQARREGACTDSKAEEPDEVQLEDEAASREILPSNGEQKSGDDSDDDAAPASDTLTVTADRVCVSDKNFTHWRVSYTLNGSNAQVLPSNIYVDKNTKQIVLYKLKGVPDQFCSKKSPAFAKDIQDENKAFIASDLLANAIKSAININLKFVGFGLIGRHKNVHPIFQDEENNEYPLDKLPIQFRDGENNLLANKIPCVEDFPDRWEQTNLKRNFGIGCFLLLGLYAIAAFAIPAIPALAGVAWVVQMVNVLTITSTALNVTGALGILLNVGIAAAASAVVSGIIIGVKQFFTDKVVIPKNSASEIVDQNGKPQPAPLGQLGVDEDGDDLAVNASTNPLSDSGDE